MRGRRHLVFNFDIGKRKFTHQGSGDQCPFCNREELSEILDKQGSLLLVKNKYQTLADTFQTVLIETDDCSADITTYDTGHLRRVITFGTDHWLKMEESGEYESVVFYKNHGPLSGGTISHAHMQIVGLKNIDYRQGLSDEVFGGIEIHKEGNCSVNLSTRPGACSVEFNIITFPRYDEFMADNIQKLVKYLLSRIKCTSYNLFFYLWNGSIICKVVPRFVTSPFLVGYSIAQTSNRLKAIAEEVQRKFYGK
ncbi:MAG: DUF4931 domain-containing protein [Fibrobacterota bacterium]